MIFIVKEVLTGRFYPIYNGGMDSQKEFIKLIDDYLEKKGMSPTGFSLAVTRDPNFVYDVRRGRGCGFKMVDKVKEYIKKNK